MWNLYSKLKNYIIYGSLKFYGREAANFQQTRARSITLEVTINGNIRMELEFWLIETLTNQSLAQSEGK